MGPAMTETERRGEMSELPDGVVTFLFTDVEGSTRMWEESPELMMGALEQHDQAIDEAVAGHDGVSVKPRGEGDSRFVVFSRAFDAVAAAADFQRRLAAIDWVTPTTLRVRTSLHTGAADLRLGDYYGSAVNRAARLRAIAHGGQTIMSGATYEVVQDELPEGVTIRDMGAHGLKDLTRPEHVYQLNVDDLQDTFAPLKSLDAVPNNLPRQLTEFVGRQSELAEAKRLLGETRLLTVLAPGGAGKTRLAIQAAADVTADYPDGVFFIGLADVSSINDIIQAVAESLGVGLSSDEDLQTQLLAYLGNKRQLLVFDNFEHLIKGTAIVEEILVAAPQVTVVVTSRSKLNLTGGTVLVLPGLETQWATPEEAFQTSGVRLFIDAARRSHSGFVLDEGDLDALAEILRLTGGAPLGILLAAAWVDMLPLADIASEIAKSLDFLETDMGDVPDRHRSVRAVFDYSWKLLGPEERKTFAALAMFRGGFTRDAAEAVTGASLRNLANLANKSLVTPSLDTGRYTVHELLRQYAEVELQKNHDQYHHVLEAHATYYGGLTEDAFALFHDSDQQGLLAAVERDIDNIRSAWRHCLATRNAAGARKIVTAFWIVYEIRGWYPSAVALFGEALDAFGEDSEDEATVVARALSSAVQAWFLALLGRLDVGEPAAANATNALRASADPEALWIALQSHALCLAYLGSSREMIAVCEEALTVGEALGHRFWVASMKSWRSFAAIIDGDANTAKKLLPEGMEVLKSLDEHFYMCWNLWLQAMIATQESRADDAIDLYTRQVARAQEIKYLRGAMVALEGLGVANVATGNLDSAETAFIKSLATADQMSMARDMLAQMTKIANVRVLKGRPSEGVDLLATVLGEPMSAQQTFTENVPISEIASEAIAELKEEMDPDEYSTAYARGTSRPFEVAVKQLLDSLDDGYMAGW